MSHVPVRTCAGCGRKAPKGELVRFVAREGRLVAGPREPGRGVYTCPRPACFERAESHRAFSRSLRQTVTIDDALRRTAAIYTGR